MSSPDIFDIIDEHKNQMILDHDECDYDIAMKTMLDYGRRIGLVE